MVTGHRREDSAKPPAYLGDEVKKQGWLGPACRHGSTSWEGAIPLCESRACLTRWLLRYMLPIILLLIAVFVLGLTVFRVEWMECGPGFEHLGRDFCVRR